jgi:hypothetical protein
MTCRGTELPSLLNEASKLQARIMFCIKSNSKSEIKQTAEEQKC